jgi:hypothetical protein
MQKLKNMVGQNFRKYNTQPLLQNVYAQMLNPKSHAQCKKET